MNNQLCLLTFLFTLAKHGKTMVVIDPRVWTSETESELVSPQ